MLSKRNTEYRESWWEGRFVSEEEANEVCSEAALDRANAALEFQRSQKIAAIARKKRIPLDEAEDEYWGNLIYEEAPDGVW